MDFPIKNCDFPIHQRVSPIDGLLQEANGGIRRPRRPPADPAQAQEGFAEQRVIARAAGEHDGQTYWG